MAFSFIGKGLEFSGPLLRAVPAFAAVFIFSTRLNETIPMGLGLPGYVRNYFVFLAVLGIFSLNMHVVRRYQYFNDRRRKSSREEFRAYRGRELRWLAAVVAVTLLMLSLLTYSKRFLPDWTFYLLLTSVGLFPIAEFLMKQGMALSSLAMTFAANSLIAYSSFQVALFNWEWQAAVFSLGLCAPLVALDIADLFADRLEALPEARRVHYMLLLSRWYGVTIVLGPVLFTLLASIDQLAMLYTLTTLLLPLAVPRIKEVQSAKEIGELSAGIRRETAGIYLLFVVMIAAFGLIARS